MSVHGNGVVKLSRAPLIVMCALPLTCEGFCTKPREMSGLTDPGMGLETLIIRELTERCGVCFPLARALRPLHKNHENVLKLRPWGKG